MSNVLALFWGDPNKRQESVDRIWCCLWQKPAEKTAWTQTSVEKCCWWYRRSHKWPGPIHVSLFWQRLLSMPGLQRELLSGNDPTQIATTTRTSTRQRNTNENEDSQFSKDYSSLKAKKTGQSFVMNQTCDQVKLWRVNSTVFRVRLTHLH